jgi:cobalt/nickel transport system permease protein
MPAEMPGGIYALEGFARKGSVLHKLHPAVKIIAVLIYIAAVISFDRYSFGRLIPFLLYPCLVIPLAGIPPSLLVKPAVLALPFCLFAGISNIIFERETALYLGAVPVSYGLLSCVTLIFRTMLCVSAALSLAALTSFPHLSAQLRRFRVPSLFVTVLEMMYRYTGVLSEEARAMTMAYELRAPGQGRRGIAMKHMGTFAGSLFLRSTFRSERIYAAMKCRLYSLRAPPKNSDPLRQGDFIFLGTVILCCAVFRFVNISLVLGRVVLRGKLW